MLDIGNTRCYRVLMEWDKWMERRGIDIEYIPKKLCDNSHQVWLRMEVRPVHTSPKLLGLVFFKISDVMLLFDVDLTDFFYFIMVYEKLFTIKNLLM